MRVLQVVDDADVVQLDVEVLVDALERAADLDVVLELDGDLVVDQGLEEAASGGQQHIGGEETRNEATTTARTRMTTPPLRWFWWRWS